MAPPSAAAPGRPFRFGLQSNGAASLSEWQDLARKVEDLGYATLVLPDHFGPQLAPLPALVAAGAVTKTLRLGTIVLDNDFRHPAVLAKEAATVDLLTDGRLELGVGAGWLAADYEKTAIPFRAPAERYERLAETVRILKAFFSEEAVTFPGKHYTLDGLDGAPKPVQRPRPRLMIGGRQKRMVSFAAREADIVGISLLDRLVGMANPPSFEEKVGWVKAAAGDRFDEIEIHVNAANLVVTDDRAGVLAEIAQRLKISAAEALASPAVLVGSVDAVCDQLQAWRERAHPSYFVVQERLIDAVAPIVARLAGR
jgi:probable F420-dependent oxidoreductase